MARTKSDLDQLESLFSALADKTRLRLLNLMRNDEVCVCFFTEVLDESQPKISRHLAYLRKAGLVEARREGKWMHYRIVEQDNSLANLVIDDTLNWFAEQEEMDNEHEALVAACCAVDVPVTIARAPKPEALLPKTRETGEQQQQHEEIETFLL